MKRLPRAFLAGFRVGLIEASKEPARLLFFFFFGVLIGAFAW